MRDCPDCGVKPGEKHEDGCDVERCPRCGMQNISCPCIYIVNEMNLANLEHEHPDIYHNGPTPEMYAKWDAEWGPQEQLWTGEWPGYVECREFGWYCRERPVQSTGHGFWMRCNADDEAARPDLNRLVVDAVWDAEKGRFVKR